MEIIYSEAPVQHAGDRKVLDPAKYEEPVPGVSVVYLAEDNLKIRYGYETIGVLVLPLSELKKSVRETPKKGE